MASVLKEHSGALTEMEEREEDILQRLKVVFSQKSQTKVFLVVTYHV